MPSAPDEKPGCLAGLLSLLRGRKPQAAAPDVLPYRLRDDFLSPAERAFYLVLAGMMGRGFTICPKVSLGDLFFVARPQEYPNAHNRINRKHVDFLICDPKSMTPVFAIELDDRSHERPDRVARDEFVDSVFAAAGLPLVHVRVRSQYDPQELGRQFREALAGRGAPQAAAAPPAPAQAAATPTPVGAQPPLCPKCGLPMVRRTSQRGPHPGQTFYGCPNYPKCRVVLPVA